MDRTGKKNTPSNHPIVITDWWDFYQTQLPFVSSPSASIPTLWRRETSGEKSEERSLDFKIVHFVFCANVAQTIFQNILPYF